MALVKITFVAMLLALMTYNGLSFTGIPRMTTLGFGFTGIPRMTTLTLDVVQRTHRSKGLSIVLQRLQMSSKRSRVQRLQMYPKTLDVIQKTCRPKDLGVVQRHIIQRLHICPKLQLRL
ncbi:hypothetical protein CR513_27209, partial [Mucuna pruriens]